MTEPKDNNRVADVIVLAQPNEEVVPSVTRLLNRKKLEISNSSHFGLFKRNLASDVHSDHPSPPLPTLPHPNLLGAIPIVLEGNTGQCLHSNETPQIRTASTRSKTEVPLSLQNWTLASLQTGSDPVAMALTRLIQQGAVDSLFLSAQVNSSNKTIAFKSSAAMADAPRKNFWTGISWNPMSSPDTWGVFVKHGFLEVPPLVSVGAAQKIFPRAAFGLENGEWLIIVRCGSIQACRGLLAITSKKSLANELKPLLLSFAAPVIQAAHVQAA